MLEKQRKLDALSSRLFFSGLVIGRFSRVNIPIIGTASFLISAALYLAGYITWQASVSQVNQAHKRVAERYKKAFEHEFQHMFQYSIAAITGIAASMAMVATPFFPITMGLTCSWLFFVSNIFWWWAENKTIKRLRTDEADTPQHKAREIYYTYTSYATLISAITCISLTVSIAFPLLAAPISTILLTNLLALNIFATISWVKSNYAASQLPPTEEKYEFAPSNSPTSSYQKIFAASPHLEAQVNEQQHTLPEQTKTTAPIEPSRAISQSQQELETSLLPTLM
jgi:uncharacterized membrane protein